MRKVVDENLRNDNNNIGKILEFTKGKQQHLLKSTNFLVEGINNTLKKSSRLGKKTFYTNYLPNTRFFNIVEADYKANPMYCNSITGTYRRSTDKDNKFLSISRRILTRMVRRIKFFYKEFMMKIDLISSVEADYDVIQSDID
ncbi:hypothetical protein [Wukongibacter baidiensis]